MDPKAYAPHFHDLKRFAKSPQYYRAGLGVEGGDTSPFRFGRLSHAVTLGVGEIHIFKGKVRNGKEWEAFKEGKDEKTIYKQDEVDEAKRIAEAVHAHPLARDFLVGKKEVPAEWTMYGRKVATRGIDILGGSFICDLKTTTNAEPHTFQRGALRYGYHAQLAMYLDAARALGSKATEAYVIAVETSAPYAVTVHRLSPRLLDEGRKLVRSWMERLRACEEADEWPGYTQSICDWDIVEDSFGLIIDGEEVAA
jgi:hypothetical protein